MKTRPSVWFAALLFLSVASGVHAQAANPHGQDMAMLDAPRAASAAPDRSLPPGTVAVEVRDHTGTPVSGGTVQLGVMNPDGTRESEATRTGPQGEARFEGLSTGQSAAYRINLIYDGAKVSSTPFRLPPDTGYRVSLQKLQVSTDPRIVFQMIGQSMIELKDDRLHITQQARLTNVGQQIFAFPPGGQLVRLPEGYMSPQFQEVMTDQKLVEKSGEGFLVQGSLPPGTVTLAWTYDISREGSEARIPVDLPWRTYMYRVITEAPDGLSLRVAGMPEAQRVEDQGRDLLVTQLQRGPEEAPLEAITMHLSGIPGPGPGRWVAVSLALLALAFGGFAVLKPGEGDVARRRLVIQRKAELLDAAGELAAQERAGDIGPEFYAERSEALTSALAIVLRDEQLLAEREPAMRPKRASKRARAARSA